MIDFSRFYQQIATSPFGKWLEVLPVYIAKWQNNNLHGHFNHWNKSLKYLPKLVPQRLDLLHSVSADRDDISARQRQGIETLLRNLIPWRKGPYSLYGTEINTEWRSDWKWERIFPHISSLVDRTVLDVGCGSGYHMWRMIGAGANFVVGIDPMQLFLFQFEAIRKLLNDDRRAHLLPFGIEKLPALQSFDTVFSMGVLCHRRSPLDHLLQLKRHLASGGELVLETLVIKGDTNQVLVPAKHYAKMRNVYFIPSTDMLKSWLEKIGFIDVSIVDVTWTTVKEQRCTDWTTSRSLAEFLDPNDQSKTVEGYPAPLRAVLIARNP